MASIRIETQLSPDDLLSALQQLDNVELDGFVQRVLLLRAQRTAPSLSAPESELLSRINNPLPEELQKRYDQLIVGRQAESLTDDEYAELLQLTSQIENIEATRVQHLADLAHLRRVTLPTLLESLGIEPNIDA